jgi:transcriptional regulator with XRE-family HTH domain
MEGNGIMADESANANLIVQQKALFRLAAAKGFTQELIHQETRISTTSLSEYATGKTKLSLVAMRRLAEVPDFPLELLSLLFPQGMAIVRVPSGINHDEIAEAMHDFLQTKERAHHPESEAGREIGPNEDNVLRGKFARVRAA